MRTKLTENFNVEIVDIDLTFNDLNVTYKRFRYKLLDYIRKTNRENRIETELVINIDKKQIEEKVELEDEEKEESKERKFNEYIDTAMAFRVE